MEKIYQTIIIGAGPAGLIAGKYLENAVILEMKDEIGKHIQCVGMSIGSLQKQQIVPDQKWVKSEIHKIERIMPNGKKIGSFKKKPLGYIVKRKIFEEILSKDIKAKLFLGEKVVDIKKNSNFWEVITERNSIFRGKYIIGADGFNSIVRKQIFPESKYFMEPAFGLESSVEFSKPIDVQCVKFYLDNKIYHKGYGWVFPTSRYSANIGVGGEK